MRLWLGAALVLTPPAVLAQAPSSAAAPATAAEPSTKGVPPDVVQAAPGAGQKAAPAVQGVASAEQKVAPASPAPAGQAVPGAAQKVAPASPARQKAASSVPATQPVPAAEEAPALKAEPALAEPALKREPSDKDRELTEAWQDPTLEPAAEAEPDSLGWTLIRTLLVLGAVVASIYLTLNVGLRRLMGLQAQSAGRQPLVSVVERLPLDQRRSLFVVKAADEYLLVGGGEAGLQLLSKLDAEAVERIRAQRPQTNVVPLSPFLQKLLSRRSGGSPSQPPGA